MKTHLVFAAVFVLSAVIGRAQVPQLINYQGRVTVGTANFDGTGQFKFALVNADGSQSFWSNDGTSTAGSEPAAAVSLTVTRGLYSVLLGDATLPNMTILAPCGQPDGSLSEAAHLVALAARCKRCPATTTSGQRRFARGS
jgi:hypothetical protein